jgi:hypothetical protein
VPCCLERGCIITAEEDGESQREQWQLQGLCSCRGREQLNNNIKMMKGKWYYYKKVKVKQARYRPGVAQRIPGS